VLLFLKKRLYLYRTLLAAIAIVVLARVAQNLADKFHLVAPL